MSALIMVLLLLTAVFLIMLVLVQRGRGGGLAGALGGMGGQSAFGTKAGDLFTRITIGVATFWIILCIVAVKYYNREDGFANLGSAAARSTTSGQPANGQAGEGPGATIPPGSSGGAPASPLSNDRPASTPAAPAK
ncbi:MAG TPA: preprotein translocase subunit SecG [Pirellulales bacterium]|jgi:preprotein translocase subunit SecG|nr:preprotein translocase subunit SecG [Pirellulales bacterium]